MHRALVERFGEQVIGEDGADREVIARIVFDDAAQLGWLEQLLHPRVAAAQLAWRDELARSLDPPRVTVAEVPLLYEAGADERFDVVVVRRGVMSRIRGSSASCPNPRRCGAPTTSTRTTARWKSSTPSRPD